MSVYVIVDDSDFDLNYTPVAERGLQMSPDASHEYQRNGWCITCSGGSYEFLETDTYSGQSFSTMNYTFAGSSITVIASLIMCPNCISTLVTFSIDGEILSTVNSSSLAQGIIRPHMPFFVSPNLSLSTTHILSIELQNSVNTVLNQSSFFFDYLLYEATPNSSISNSTGGTSWIFVDDTSPYLQYDDGWSKVSDVQPQIFGDGQDQNITDASFNSTLMRPTGAGSKVALDFTGVTRMRAFAYVPSQPTSNSLGAYTIDNWTSTDFAFPSSDSWPLVNFELFNIGWDVNDDLHSVFLTSGSDGVFYLDYILLQKSTATISSLSSGINNTGGTSSGGGTQSTTRPKPVHRTSVGTIVGGVVGAIVALAAITLTLYLFFRRRGSTRRNHTVDTAANITPFDGYDIFGQAHATSQMDRDGLDNVFSTTPFSFPLSTDEISSSTMQNSADIVRSLAKKLAVTTGDSSGRSANRGGPTRSPEAQQSLSLRRESRVPNATRHRVIVESDSGLRGVGEDESDGTGTVYLPPHYTLE